MFGGEVGFPPSSTVSPSHIVKVSSPASVGTSSSTFTITVSLLEQKFSSVILIMYSAVCNGPAIGF